MARAARRAVKSAATRAARGVARGAKSAATKVAARATRRQPKKEALQPTAFKMLEALHEQTMRREGAKLYGAAFSDMGKQKARQAMKSRATRAGTRRGAEANRAATKAYRVDPKARQAMSRMKRRGS